MFFSIVIPVYNSEKYIEETINSIITQSIGFEEKVELIIVDDGSNDRSGDICKAYRDKYPSNIKYLRVQNGGPSNARNVALDNISTETLYVGFIDSDDKYESNALEKVYEFFQTHTSGVAVIPFHYFDAKTGEHRLNYRFEKGTREINILVEPEAINFYIVGAFFKREIIQKYRFDVDLRFFEDALLLNELLLTETTYGVIAGTKYHYRKRKDATSLVDTAWFRKDRYTNHLQKGYRPLIVFSINQHDKIIPYIQYLIAYHIKLYIFERNNKHIFTALDVREREEFFKVFSEILTYVDDENILKQNMKSYYIEILLSMKHKGYGEAWERYEARPNNSDLYFYWKENFIGKLTEKKMKLRGRELKGFFLELTGDFVNNLYDMKEEDKIFISYQGKDYYAERTKVNRQVIIWNKVIKDFKYSGFKVKVPIFIESFQFGVEINGQKILLNKVNCRHIIKEELKEKGRKLFKIQEEKK